MGAAFSRRSIFSRLGRAIKKPFCRSSSRGYAVFPDELPEQVYFESKSPLAWSEKIKGFEMSREQVRQFDRSPDASRASCKFADSGPQGIGTPELRLYRRQVPGTDGHVVIGVGHESASGEIIPLVLIENDNNGHGIHFTGCLVDNPSRCLVACLRQSSYLHPVVRHIIYIDFLRNLQNRSAAFIWDWWRSGVDMDRLDRLIRSG